MKERRVYITSLINRIGLIDICVDAINDAGRSNEQQNQIATYIYPSSTDDTPEINNGWNDIF